MDASDQKIPSDFDSQTYLLLNPDLKNLQVNLSQHYLEHGKAEGRHYRIDPPKDFSDDFYSKYAPEYTGNSSALSAHWWSIGRQEGFPFNSRTLEENRTLKKWYFCISETSLDRPDHNWRGLILNAVISARIFTDLEPVLIYDGNESEFIDLLRQLGVKVIFHRVSIYGTLESKFYNHPQTLAIASGAFLRIDIPEIESEDPYVLYTDCDVVFKSHPTFNFQVPVFFACAPQTSRIDYENDMNSGVMVLNVKGMREELPAFRKFIVENLSSGWPGFDQEHYRRYFKNRWGFLPLKMNWKPYWGFNPNAEIVHWHGPKPDAVFSFFSGSVERLDADWEFLIKQGNSDYASYLEEYKSISSLGMWLLNVKLDYMVVGNQEIFNKTFRDRLERLNQIALNSQQSVEGNLCYHHLKKPENMRMPDPTRKEKRITLARAVSGKKLMLETGFNAGHSALIALSANSELVITSIDIFMNKYVEKCSAYLMEEYLGRLEVLRGDSTNVLPNLVERGLKKFDFFHIDGGHGAETCRNDIENCLKLALPGAEMLVDDTNDPSIMEVVSEFLRHGKMQIKGGFLSQSAGSTLCLVI